MSPVIAVLLLIAIAVATGILVYVWVSGLAGALTSGGGGTQVSEQMSMDTYDFTNTSNVTIVIRNSGASRIILDRIYFDGNAVAIAIVKNGTTVVYRVSGLSDTTYYNCSSGSSYYLSVIDGLPSSFTGVTGANIKGNMTLDAEATLTLSITLKSSAIPGSSHIIKIITADGAIFSFSVIAGRYS